MKIVIPYKKTVNEKEVDGFKVIEVVEAVYNAIAIDENDVKIFPVEDETSIPEFTNLISDFNPDCIFNLFESFRDNNYGEVWFAGLLELMNIPYTGSPPRVLATCLNKNLTKIIFNNYKIPTPEYYIIRFPADIRNCSMFPGFVKPVNEDASAGIDAYSFVKNRNQLKKKIERLVNEKFEPPYMVEQYIAGAEYTVPMFQGEPLSIIKYVFPEGFNFRTYKLKWEIEREEEQIEFITDSIPKKLKEKIFNYCRRIYRLFKIHDYARIDLRLNSERKIFFLEANPNPDITPYTGLCISLKNHGISYKEFVETLINNAIERCTYSPHLQLFT